MIGVNLVSEKYGIKGNADEVHTLADGTMAPLDYKFARYDERLFKTYKNQLVMYAIMIEETLAEKSIRDFWCIAGKETDWWKFV